MAEGLVLISLELCLRGIARHAFAAALGSEKERSTERSLEAPFIWQRALETTHASAVVVADVWDVVLDVRWVIRQRIKAMRVHRRR